MTVTVNFTGTPLSGEETLSVTFTLTYEVTSDAAQQASGVRGTAKRRPYRVRRADFTSEASYQMALKAALADSQFAFAPYVEAPPVVRAKPRPRLPKTIPLDKSLSLDSEIAVAKVERERIDREEEALIMRLIQTIEENW